MGHEVRLTTRSASASRAYRASLSGRRCKSSRALSACARANARVLSTPDDRCTKSLACKYSCDSVSCNFLGLESEYLPILHLPGSRIYGLLRDPYLDAPPMRRVQAQLPARVAGLPLQAFPTGCQLLHNPTRRPRASRRNVYEYITKL